MKIICSMLLRLFVLLWSGQRLKWLPLPGHSWENKILTGSAFLWLSRKSFKIRKLKKNRKLLITEMLKKWHFRYKREIKVPQNPELLESLSPSFSFYDLSTIVMPQLSFFCLFPHRFWPSTLCCFALRVEGFVPYGRNSLNSRSESPIWPKLSRLSSSCSLKSSVRLDVEWAR